MSYVQRKLQVTIGIGKGENGEKGQDKYILPDGLRITMDVDKMGGLTMGSVQGRIFGLTLDFMNKVSTLGQSPIRSRNNQIYVTAGDDVNGMSLLFQGTLQEAWHDFQGSPDTFLFVTGYAGLRENLRAVPPTTYRGTVNASVIMAGLATTMDLDFENNGVDVTLSNPYYPGTAREQAIACAAEGHFQQFIDNGKLIIVPMGQSRGEELVLLNKDTGMIGYPSVGGQNNIKITTLFNPNIGYLSKVKVESIIKPANGIWTVYKINHQLESESPNGPWFTSLEACPPDAAPPVRA